MGDLISPIISLGEQTSIPSHWLLRLACTHICQQTLGWISPHLQIQIHPPGKCHLYVPHRYTWWAESHPEIPKHQSLWTSKWWKVLLEHPCDCYSIRQWQAQHWCVRLYNEKNMEKTYSIWQMWIFHCSWLHLPFFLIWVVEIQSLWLQALLIVSKGGGKQSSDGVLQPNFIEPGLQIVPSKVIK